MPEKVTKDRVIEISRCILPRQRALFTFLQPLKEMVEVVGVGNAPLERQVRVNLVDRFDHVVIPGLDKPGVEIEARDRLFAVRSIVTCDWRAEVELGNPIVVDKGDGWKTVEMPIAACKYDFAKERVGLVKRVDAVLGDPNALWEPREPALQIVELRADQNTADAVSEYVAAHAPHETELFEASVRLRRPIV